MATDKDKKKKKKGNGPGSKAGAKMGAVGKKVLKHSKRAAKTIEKASKKIGGSQGARAGMMEKGGKNRMITENFKRYRESIPLGKTPRPRKR